MKAKTLICLVLNILISFSNFSNAIAQKDTLEKEVKTVSKRLLSVLEYSGNMEWPPAFEIVESNEINAYAGIIDNKPKVVMNTAIDTITAGIPDRLAYILAHELIHIVKGHCKNSGFASTGTLKYNFSRADEEVADIEGLQLLGKAGYSNKVAINTFKVMRKIVGDYSPLEAQSVDHPSWTQRLEYIDKVQINLWQSMSAFNTGVTLLMVQNYDAAIVCFNKVIKEFPKCFEAYSNIGYAYLMKYCDNLEVEDIASYNIGQIVIGGFYRRPGSLENEIRGFDKDSWWNAIGNFKRALDLNPDLSLVKSYLGIAYFLDPEKLSLKYSEQYMTEALRSVEKDETLDPLLKACVYLNAGALEMGKANFSSAEHKTDTARIFQTLFKKGRSTVAFTSNVMGNISYSTLFDLALDFNTVLTQYKKSKGILKNENLPILLKYLRNTDPASIWWKIAYQVYHDGSVNLGQKSLTSTQILSEVTPLISPVRSVIINDYVIFLSQKMDEILNKFPDYSKVPIVEERKIFKYIFPDQHIEIIADKEVLGVFIEKSDSLLKLGSTAEALKDVKIGMPYETIRSRFDGLNFCYLTLPENQIKYYFYNDIGIAFAVKDTKISEMLIIQKPSENK